MLADILPPRLDNAYRGHRVALWFFTAVLVTRTGVALRTIFDSRTVAQWADGIPLDSFGSAGSATVLSLFALWGISQLATSAVGVVALIRYRAMIPFMFVLLLVEHASRRLFLLVKPIPKATTPIELYMNLVVLAIMVVGLILSLRK